MRAKILDMHLNKNHSDWLEKQKITQEVLKDFQIHTNDFGLITFPVVDSEGNFIFNKYRRSPEIISGPKYSYDRGGFVNLYGYFQAKNSSTVLFVEGEKDCLVCWSHNIPAVTSTGGAMSFKEEWVEMLKDKEIILCFDNDKAGGEGMAKTAKMFGLDKVKLLFLPTRSGVKDISDYVLNGGNLHDLVRTAKNVLDVREDMSNRRSLWKDCFFHEAWLKEDEKMQYTPSTKKVADSLVAKAKQFPIPELIEFNRAKKACCPFHKEKTPSLYYNQETNTAYCFGGCGRPYDAIDIYRKLNKDASFKEAIRKLS